MIYLGGKTRYVKYICPIIQNEIEKTKFNTFIDVFVGGANIIKNIKSDVRIGIDNNKCIIALLKEIQDNGIKRFPKDITKDEFLYIRDNKDLFDDWYVGLASIARSYNGAGFNAGFATDNSSRKYYEERVRMMAKEAMLFKNIEFIYHDYKFCLNYSNSVVYFDPPYRNKRKYDTSNNFNYEEFWEVVRKCKLNNNSVFVSELDAPNDYKLIWQGGSKKNFTSTKTLIKECLFTL